MTADAPETPQAPRPAPGTPQRGSVDGGDGNEALRAAVTDVCRRMDGSGVFEAGVWARVLRETLADLEGGDRG